MAQELWKEMNADLTKFYPAVTPSFASDFQLLGDTSKSPDDLRAALQRLVEQLQKA